jgi:Putative addiction module component
MLNNVDALRREALALPVSVRADLAAELLASLDESAVDDLETVRAMWSEELERRAEWVLSRRAVGEDWDSLRQRLATALR